MIKRIIKLILITAVIVSCSDKSSAPGMIPTDAELESRVEKTLKGMTLEEKVGQMVQLTISVLEDDTHEALDPAKLDEIFGVYKIGSILNVMNGRAHTREQTASMIRQIQEKSMEMIGIPCVYGLDMVHGANYLTDGTIFPHEINIAATFDPAFARRMGVPNGGSRVPGALRESPREASRDGRGEDKGSEMGTGKKPGAAEGSAPWPGRESCPPCPETCEVRVWAETASTAQWTSLSPFTTDMMI